MSITPRRSLAAVAAGLAVAFSLTTAISTAAAAEAPIKLGLRPSTGAAAYPTLHLPPGGNATITVDLSNDGVAPVRARTYAADAYSVINGGFGARSEEDARSGPTTWLDYEPEAIDLSPGKHEERSLTVAVPRGVDPGEYVTALVIQNEEPAPITGSTGVRQTVRTAMAVVVDVPGPSRPALTIGNVDHAFSSGTSVVGFGLANPGNIHVRPAAAFELEAEDGRKLDSLAAPLDSIYAWTATRAEFPLERSLSPGRYRARLVLNDDQAGVSADSGWQWFVVGQPPAVPSDSTPLPLLIALLLAALVAIVLIAERRRRRRAGQQAS